MRVPERGHYCRGSGRVAFQSRPSCVRVARLCTGLTHSSTAKAELVIRLKEEEPTCLTLRTWDSRHRSGGCSASPAGFCRLCQKNDGVAGSLPSRTAPFPGGGKSSVRSEQVNHIHFVFGRSSLSPAQACARSHSCGDDTALTVAGLLAE